MVLPIVGYPPQLAVMRTMQRNLMADRCDLTRNGVVVATDQPMRVGAERMFTEPSDPQEASPRAQVQWGFTFPHDADVRVGDLVTFGTPEEYTILGEVLTQSTWQIAIRAYGSKPKIATELVEVTFWRYNPVTEENDIEVPAQAVRLLWDRVAPEEAPLRYAPAGRATWQGGWFVKENVLADGPLDVQVGDQFTLFGSAGVITEVFGGVQLSSEAEFIVDIGGVR